MLMRFFSLFHLYLLSGRGRIRFEVTLRLGNASIIMSTSDSERKLNQHSVALLEKYVSKCVKKFIDRTMMGFYAFETLWHEFPSDDL